VVISCSQSNLIIISTSVLAVPKLLPWCTIERICKIALAVVNRGSEVFVEHFEYHLGDKLDQPYK